MHPCRNDITLVLQHSKFDTIKILYHTVIISKWCIIWYSVVCHCTWYHYSHLLLYPISVIHHCVYTISLQITATIYNYRLLMRSTHDHEDRVRYWLTDAVSGGQPILDKVFMVMSRHTSKVYNCFIKLSRIFLQKDWHIHNYCWCYRWCKSSVAKNRNPEYTATHQFAVYSLWGTLK